MVGTMYLLSGLKWHPASHPSLVLVAWLTYSDWLIIPSPAAGVLNAQFGSLDIGSLFATMLPPTYNIELGEPGL